MKNEQNKTIHTQKIDYDKWLEEENARYAAQQQQIAIRKAAFDEKWGPLQKKFYILLGILLIAFIAWYVLVGVKRGPSSEIEGDGTISVFPSANSVTNYQLDATIDVVGKPKSLFSNYQEYTVVIATWPNGGTLQFQGQCVVDGLSQQTPCTADDGTQYYIEVTDPPQAD
jgi:hypothetical protein